MSYVTVPPLFVRIFRLLYNPVMFQSPFRKALISIGISSSLIATLINLLPDIGNKILLFILFGLFVFGVANMKQFEPLKRLMSLQNAQSVKVNI